MTEILSSLVESIFEAVFVSAFEAAWRLLPDRCSREGCCRRGVRGNEVVVSGKITCDYCHAKATKD